MKYGSGLRKWRKADRPRLGLDSVSKEQTDPGFVLFSALASRRHLPGNVRSEDSTIASSVQPDLPATSRVRDHGWHGRRSKRRRPHDRHPLMSRQCRTEWRLENEAAFFEETLFYARQGALFTSCL